MTMREVRRMPLADALNDSPLSTAIRKLVSNSFTNPDDILRYESQKNNEIDADGIMTPVLDGQPEGDPA